MDLFKHPGYPFLKLKAELPSYRYGSRRPDLAELLKMIEYKPTVELFADGEQHFRIRAETFERSNPGQPVRIFGTGWVPDHVPLEEAIFMIRRALHDLELHEADEWFKFRGERLFDPHLSEQHRRQLLEKLRLKS